MRKVVLSVFIMVLAGAVLAVSPVWGMETNLSANPEMTTRIQVFDPEDFTQGFDVYAAGVREDPTALLFDRKDDYYLPGKFWGKPLSHEEIVYAIKRLNQQYQERLYNIPFDPQALNVVNAKGEVLGYVYTGLTDVLMDREQDGRVTVFRPFLTPRDALGGSDGESRN